MKKLPFLPLLAAMLLLVSCAEKSPSSTAAVKLQPFTKETETRSLKMSTAFADGFAEAVKTGDFKYWQQVLPPHVAAKVTPEVFKKMCGELAETFGKLESSTFFGTLENGNLRDNLWKLRFVKDGKVREVLYLVRVYCAENGQPEISGFGIRRF